MNSEASSATIMLVDDEELILTSLRTLFALQTDHTVLTFTSPDAAIEALRRTPVDLIISDYLMPRMTGIDFLIEARKVQPEAARILLTGFSDKESAIRAINLAGLYQYMEKPWDNDELLLMVRNGLKEKSLRMQLSEKVKALGRLSSEHRELTMRHHQLEQELEMAARVQRSLLPTCFPKIEGFRFATYYQPCQALGGDYYGVFANEKQAIVLVSDVSGHGMQAALASMLLDAIFREAAPQAQSPCELLQAMNTRLHRFLPEGMFVAATLAWLNLPQRDLLLAGAGLPSPFLLSRAEQRCDEIPLHGTPLGIFGQDGPGSFDVRELKPRPGDVFLIASDGLGEVRGENEEFFQDSQLRRTLDGVKGQDGEAVIAELIRQTNEFSHHEALHDDLSLVAITTL